MKNKAFALAAGVIVLFAGLFFYLKNTTSTESALSADGEVSAQAASATQQANQQANQQPGFRVVPADKNLLIKSHSISKGANNARVTIVEFLDPECEACAAMYPYAKKVLQEFEKDVRFVVRYMPYHGNSKFVANILEGARAQGKYWETLELLFATQRQWGDHHQPRPDLIPDLLKPLDLKLDQILADAKAGKYDALIMQDVEDGRNAGVEGTPTFFVNNQKLEDLGYEPLREAVRQALK